MKQYTQATQQKIKLKKQQSTKHKNTKRQNSEKYHV